jgi:hypothetical protein
VESVVGPEQRAINSYRFAVRRLIPKFMQVQVLIHRRRFPQEKDDEARHQFLKKVAQAEYSNLPFNAYRTPGVGTHALALVVRVVPKVGTLRILSLKAPSSETSDLYFSSMNTSVGRLRELTRRLRQEPSEDLVLANLDLDTGKQTEPGAYRLTDDTYARLLNRLTTQSGVKTPPALRDDILLFYSNPNAPISTKKNRRAWARVIKGLNQLRSSAGP